MNGPERDWDVGEEGSDPQPDLQEGHVGDGRQ